MKGKMVKRLLAVGLSIAMAAYVNWAKEFLWTTEGWTEDFGERKIAP